MAAHAAILADLDFDVRASCEPRIVPLSLVPSWESGSVVTATLLVSRSLSSSLFFRLGLMRAGRLLLFSAVCL